MTNQSKTIITHDGTFHTDDIFACATVALVLEKKGEAFAIIRSRDAKVIDTGDFVLDIGGEYKPDEGMFDHHQVGGAGRRGQDEEEIEYASFGLVWRKFGEELADGKEEMKLIDKYLVAPIDANDNGFSLTKENPGIRPFLIQDIFSLMRPTWREEKSNIDEVFLSCVSLAKNILSRQIIHVKDAISAKKEVLKIYEATEDKRILVLDADYPFQETLENIPEPLFVIYPRTSDGFWSVKTVRRNANTFETRKSFPLSWAGLREAELQKVTGVSDAVFCHRALFMAVAKSKEGAMALAKQALVES